MIKTDKLNDAQRKAALSAVRTDKAITKSTRLIRQIAEAAPFKADYSQLPGFKEIRLQWAVAKLLELESPFFRAHDGRSGAKTTIGGKELINFSSYDYLGLNSHDDVMNAAKTAIDQYGISASASRVVGGERPIHSVLEKKIAELYGAESSIVFVSGHATNVSTIGQILQPNDLVLHDAFIHNSIAMGIKLSGAKRLSFPHNDFDSLERIIASNNKRDRKILIVVEGVYSMDGDCPDLPRLIALKRKYEFWLMVDEAHSLGILGKTGLGLAEHYNIDPTLVDIWMGTFSKTLAGCGGYIVGAPELVDYLKFSAPSFVFSVGMPPLLANSVSKAIDKMLAEPERVTRAQKNGKYFLKAAKKAGLDTGTSAGHAVIPIMIGDSIKATVLASRLLNEGINVLPIIHPAVPEKSARLRFFITSEHTPQQLDEAVAACLRVNKEYDENPITMEQLIILDSFNSS